MTGLIRRRAVTRHRHAKADPVTPELREYVLRRDGECVAAKLGFDHVCRDRMGRTHAPFATGVLTLEHVKSELRMGVRAPSDARHLVALCALINNQPPSKWMRESFREYLERVEGVAHG